MRPFNTVININIIIGQKLTSLITSSNTNFSLIFTMLSLDPCRYLTPAQLLCYDDNEGDLGRRLGKGHLATTGLSVSVSRPGAGPGLYSHHDKARVETRGYS